MKYHTYKTAVAGKELPIALIDLAALDENIARSLARNNTPKTIRVASKSLRCIEALRYVFDKSPVFRGLMTYSGAEALYLLQNGFDDILMGYPTTNHAEITALAHEIKQGKKVVFMVDSQAHLEQLASIADAQAVQLPVCLDIDMSMDIPGLHFGVWRSSLRSMDDVKAIAAVLKTMPQLQCVGIMGYEAQIAGIPDATPGKFAYNQLVKILKKRSIRLLRKFRAEAVAYLTEAGFTLSLVNGGGTGSLESTREESVVTELTIGSGFYSPTVFDHYADFQYHPAVFFALSVVRIPKPGVYTCLGGGYIASGSAGNAKLPKVFLPETGYLIDNEGAGEVMTPVFFKENPQLKIGDPIFFRHAKAGELCERFPCLHVLSEGKIIGTWNTYRGDGRCFI